MKDNWEKINDLLSILPSICDEYISISLKNNMKASTLSAYLYEITCFFRYLVVEGKCDSLDEISIVVIQNISVDDINNYIFDSGQMPNGKPRSLTALRHFFNYLYMNKKIPFNVALMATTPKKPVSDEKKSSIPLSQMLENAETGEGLSSTELSFRERTCNRDLAILRLVILYGLLPVDINSLNQEDIDFENSQLYLKNKFIKLDLETLDILNSYINEERMPLVSYEPALFIGSRSYRNRLGIRTIEKLVKKYCKTNSSTIKKIKNNEFKEL